MKIHGYNNPADLDTKHLAATDVQRHAGTLSLEFWVSRAGLAPQLAPTKEVNSVKAANCGNEYWKEQSCEVVRIHKKLRRELFTPA